MQRSATVRSTLAILSLYNNPKGLFPTKHLALFVYPQMGFENSFAHLRFQLLPRTRSVSRDQAEESRRPCVVCQAHVVRCAAKSIANQSAHPFHFLSKPNYQIKLQSRKPIPLSTVVRAQGPGTTTKILRQGSKVNKEKGEAKPPPKKKYKRSTLTRIRRCAE